MAEELELLRKLRRDDGLDPTFLTHARRELMATIEQTSMSDAGLQSGTQRIIPHLIYDDVAAAIEWLSSAFGFEERRDFRMLEPDGTIGHAEVHLGGELIMLGPPSVHGNSPSRGVSTMINVYVDDVDAHCEAARAAGADIVLEPEDQPWGDRRYQAKDPEGHQWHFAQRIR